MKKSNVIALLTDFGLKDHYVGVMKGAILRINPEARIIDVSHDIDSQNVLDAYFLLSNTYHYFPDGSIFVTVVDPDVGTDRAILAVRTDRYLFLAPDNGILGFLARKKEIRGMVRVTNPKYFLHPVSDTFHGRDIFAPVAAHLSRGVGLGKLGPKAEAMVRIQEPVPHVGREGVIVGEVISIDRFGNLITNIPGDRLSAADVIEIRTGRHAIRKLSRSYTAGRRGEVIALVGSTGNIEIAVNRGDAREKTGMNVGDVIRARHFQK